MRGNYYKFQLRNSKSKHYFQREEITTNFHYKIKNQRRYLNVSRNIIIQTQSSHKSARNCKTNCE